MGVEPQEAIRDALKDGSVTSATSLKDPSTHVRASSALQEGWNVDPMLIFYHLIALQDSMVAAALAKARLENPDTAEPLDALGMEGEEEEAVEDENVEEQFV